MPPPNTTSGTAVVIPSIPYVIQQTGIHDAGTTFSVWYRYTADGTEGLIGEYFRGEAGGPYTPSVNLYIDNDATLLGSISANRMSQTPFLSGRTYFFEIVPNGGNPNPATLNINLVKQPRGGKARGDIFIRAASILPSFTAAGYTGLAGGIINPTNGVLKDFEPVFPTGESGDYLPGGELMFADELNPPFTQLKIYSPSLAEIMSVTYDYTQSFPIVRSWREGNKWLVVSKGQAPTPIEWTTLTPTGVLATPTPCPASFGCTAGAISPAGDFVYLAGIGGSVGAAIKKWSVAGVAFVADFAAGVANHVVQDLLVMENGEVVALYHQSATDSIFVRVYSAAGAILQTYTAPAVGYTSIAPRLGYANDDSISFWLFLHQSDGFSRFINVKLSDVSVLGNITSPSSDYFQADQGVSPAFRLVASDSCPFVLLLAVQGGIFSVTPTDGTTIPTLRRDRYYNNLDKKIPNPTVRTALIGD